MTIREKLTKEFLFEEHINKRKSGTIIGNENDCTNAYVCMLLKEYGIPNKSNEYKRGVPCSSKTKFKSGQRPWNLGISTPSPNKGKTFPRGENHWNYKGGPKKTRHQADPYHRDWRKLVFERDNYTCVFCGQRGGILNADHILPYSLFLDRRYDLDNGRTLCVPCHRTTDTYGGRVRKRNDGGTMKSVTLT